VLAILSVIKEPKRPETCLAVEDLRELHPGWTSATDLVDYHLDSGVGRGRAPAHCAYFDAGFQITAHHFAASFSK